MAIREKKGNFCRITYFNVFMLFFFRSEKVYDNWECISAFWLCLHESWGRFAIHVILTRKPHEVEQTDRVDFSDRRVLQ